jgi:hypothetical protein
MMMAMLKRAVRRRGGAEFGQLNSGIVLPTDDNRVEDFVMFSGSDSSKVSIQSIIIHYLLRLLLESVKKSRTISGCSIDLVLPHYCDLQGSPGAKAPEPKPVQ